MSNGTSLPPVPTSRRDWLVTLLLAVFVGKFGVDRSYTGHIGFGLLKLFTCGGFGFWWFIGIIQIAVGSYRDSDGRLLDKR